MGMGVPWSKAGYDGRIIMMRKRNNSGSESGNGNIIFHTQIATLNIFLDAGSSLLCNPSSALQKLVPKSDITSVVVNPPSNNDEKEMEDILLLQRPVMQFLLQQHDLESLQIAMKQAVR